MRIRSVLKWFTLFVVLIGASLAGSLWWFWNRSDQLLYQEIEKRLSEKAPGWTLQLGDARFDWQNQSRVYLSNLSLQAPGQYLPLVTFPLIEVHLDGDLLRENMQILVRKVLIHDCHINAIRSVDGEWNLDALRMLNFKTTEDVGFPEILLQQASVNLTLEHDSNQLSTSFSVENAQMACVPAGKMFYQVDGLAEISRLGTLRVKAVWDIAHGRWELNGNINGLPANGDLLELISDVKPDAREKLVRVDRRLQQICHSGSLETESEFESAIAGTESSLDSELRYAEAVTPETHNLPPMMTVSHLKEIQSQTDDLPNFGLSGELQVHFRVNQESRGAPLDYKCLLELHQGVLDNPLLPFPLRQLEGSVYLDKHQILVRDVRAVNGKTTVELTADLAMHGLTTPGTIDVSVTNLPLSTQLKSLLNPGLQKAYDALNPTGVMNARGKFHYDGFGGWRQENVIYEFRDSTVTFSKFPYPIQHVEGTIEPQFHQSGETVFEYRFRGKAGQRPVTMTGWSRPKDEGGQAHYQMQCSQLPLDETFLEACTPSVEKALRSLNLHGKTDLNVVVSRSSGQQEVFDHRLKMEVTEGSLEYEKFPYPVRNLRGKVSFDSRDQVWLIRDVKGNHAEALVTASGTVNRRQTPHRMELSLLLTDAAIDHQLEHAMSGVVPTLWDELSPSGKVTAQAKFLWMPERDYLNVELPSVKISEGSLLLKSFQYAFDDVEASLAYSNGRVNIEKLSAKHADTTLHAKGEYQVEPQGLWRLTFDKLVVEDLLPDRHFRNALPKSLAEGLDSLAPEGNVTLVARLFELRGSQRDPQIPMTAAWDLTGIMAGMNLFAGIDVKNAHGQFTSRGTWDGVKVQARGNINLDSAYCLSQQLTRIDGPFVVNDRVLTIGKVGDTNNKSLTANVLVNGELSIDARAILGEEQRDVYGRLSGEPTRYKAIVRLRGAPLEEYLRRNGSPGLRLQGIMNGELTLEGYGQDPKNLVGDGNVVIKPAALYELPVVLQIFQRLNIAAPPDNAAFDEAFLEFKIRNEKFEFSKIDLLGNTLSLRGRGTVRFDEKLDLVFFSIVPKSQPVIPLVREIVRSASYGWVAVDVKGSVSQPITQVKTNFVLDNALRNFLESFQPVMQGVVPPLNQSTQGRGPQRQ